jgi:hypothetical protein
MTSEEIDELLKKAAENDEQSRREQFAYSESEEWRELLAMLEAQNKLKKDLPAFDVSDWF